MGRYCHADCPPESHALELRPSCPYVGVSYITCIYCSLLQFRMLMHLPSLNMEYICTCIVLLFWKRLYCVKVTLLRIFLSDHCFSMSMFTISYYIFVYWNPDVSFRSKKSLSISKFNDNVTHKHRFLVRAYTRWRKTIYRKVTRRNIGLYSLSVIINLVPHTHKQGYLSKLAYWKFRQQFHLYFWGLFIDWSWFIWLPSGCERLPSVDRRLWNELWPWKSRLLKELIY